ncbi:UNVERIFIED_CONTAM: hypothetical protein FKN15_023168 [Acipenser sinensis]
MALHPRPSSLVLSDWQRSPESRDYFNSIMHRNRRKHFGLLEAPVLPLQAAADTVSYKVFVSGKSGVGKSALVAKLAGLEVPSMHYETTGIQTTVVYWPVKLRDNGRVLLFRFQLWDCGENALRKFDHLLPVCIFLYSAVSMYEIALVCITLAAVWSMCSSLPPTPFSPTFHISFNLNGYLSLPLFGFMISFALNKYLAPALKVFKLQHMLHSACEPQSPLCLSQACRDQTDAVLHLFSFTDRSSFDDLSNQITRISESAGSNVKLVVGTKFDQFMHTDVTERELREFQQAWAVPVFCFQSAGGGTGRAGLADIAPVLNGLAEQLWTQDLQAARLHTC